MKLWVGLGNPGAEYAHNRHNIGFMALDAIASAQSFAPWRGKFRGQLTEGRIGPDKLLLLKPETFMNLSGDSVQAAMTFFKLTPGDVTVFHDELDLEAGKVRLKTGGGHAGHNGLRSIDAHIGPAFHRVRLGIGHPGDKRFVVNHVLGDFAKSDAEWLSPMLTGIAESAPLLASGDDARFLSALALRLAPPKPAAPKRPPAPKPDAPRPDAPKAEAPEPDTRDPLQKLADRFK